MAQINPVLESSSLSSTGGTNEPLNTGSTYGNTQTQTPSTTTTTTTNPTTTHHSSSTTTGTGSTGDKIHSAGSGVKGILAGIHGAGEKIRGEFNAGVDEGFGEKEGVAKNRAVANAGDNEMTSGQFSTGTKNREGALPGSDHERRF